MEGVRGFPLESLAINGMMASRLSMRFARNLGKMAGHCVVEWLLTTQKRENGVLAIDMADKGGENNCRSCCRWSHNRTSLGANRDGEEELFFARLFNRRRGVRIGVVSVSLSASRISSAAICLVFVTGALLLSEACCNLV